MPKTKISEFSATPGNNTDIDGINIAEGCPPSGINDAIRELMAQLKDFQAGTAGDSFNGPIGTTTPAAGTFTNLSASGTFALTGDQVQISEGGTGQTTANAAFNALAPSQTSNAGKYLKTDGTNTSWDALDISTADITGTLPIANGGTGLTALGTGVQTALGQNVTGSGGIVLASSPSLTTPNLGTPSAVTLTNATGLPLSTGVTGTLATTNGGTGLTSFTANGVVYASSSSALTTGSALTFDGTNLGLSSSAAATVVKIDGSGRYKQFEAYQSGTREFYVGYDSTSLIANITTDLNRPIAFSVAGVEAMRLTSTGLGIGTSSPAAKLDVIGSSSDQLRLRSDAGAYYRIGRNSSDGLLDFYASQTGFQGYRFGGIDGTWMTLNTSGNLGLGVTPSAGTSGKVFQITNAGHFMASGPTVYIDANAYFDSGWKYITTAAASNYYQNSGAHIWQTAPSGTAGDPISFTQALTLNANGALVLQGGNTSASGVGVAFPATQVASSDANTLDDYEEGTFTATLKGGTTDPTTPVTTTGYYTKIGNLVNVVIQFSNVTTTGAAGEAYATGLPFTSSASSSEIGSIMCYQFDFNGLTSASCYVGAGTTNLFPYMSGNNSAWNGLRHNAGTGRYLWMSVTYRAA